ARKAELEASPMAEYERVDRGAGKAVPGQVVRLAEGQHRAGGAVVVVAREGHREAERAQTSLEEQHLGSTSARPGAPEDDLYALAPGLERDLPGCGLVAR